ncbi:TlpA disulfide reductase family protein [Niabella drilacis]|uniref:Thiol-disulfide isomerase or thioredoxin n=1 Tax=Niabella drilacis (strain DSM 25811 / CCM 8410 / CCUG 62505 / LMG 26954 / E90) TaxID=1285928 RepID=A0A1G6PJW7_NIADE|nr:TlpA disulfide reductase family protein [Niabella drilacis]SDC80520.1 Thiol-disulfide isomerase or thioredoxin [Niabella drilacis]
MRAIMPAFFLLLCQSVHAQEFILNGTITDRDTGTVILNHTAMNGEWVQDTSEVRGGKFTFKGTVKGMDLAFLQNDPQYSIKDETLNAFFVLEPGLQSVVYRYGNLKEAQYSGSETYREKAAWDSIKKDELDRLALLDRKRDSLLSEMRSGSMNADPQPQLVLIDQQAAPLKEKIKQMDYRFITGNPSSKLSLYLLYAKYVNWMSADSLMILYGRFPQTLQKSALGVYLFNYAQKKLKGALKTDIAVAAFDNIRTGQRAPDFSIIYSKDSVQTLRTFRGKVLLIEQWNLACIPCLRYNPHLEKLRGQYAGKGLVVLSVIDKTDGLHSKLLAYISNASLGKWLHVYSDIAGDAPIPGGTFKGYQVNAIPATVLVDRSGVVRYKSTSFDPTQLAKLKQEVKRVVDGQ